MRPDHRPPVLLLALSLAAAAWGCDDDPSPGALDAAVDAAVEPEPDLGPEPDAAPDAAPDPEGCVFPDVERAGGVVETTRGLVRGRQDEGVWVWQGVPFAAAPVGERRFRAPEPHPCWDDVRPAEAFGPVCPQLEFGADGSVSTTGDEDCLTLNVWSPSADDGARPVLVFIHGGGNIIGSAREEIAPGAYIYDGRALAARGDAVVVTVQYRLGPLGFMTLPELDAESPTGTSGNQALLDQIAALEWVRDNIAAFGGDPGRVMVFGESAGAVNTCMMVATPLSQGLVHAALMQSGGCGAAPRAVAQQGAAAAAELMGCGGDERLACLRAADPFELVERASGSVGIGASPTENGLSWGPTVDGHVLPAAPLDRFAAGEHAPIPVVVGSNRDEMASRSLNRIAVDSPDDYARAVNLVFGALGMPAVDRIFEMYPVDAFESPDDAFIQVTTDAFFTCTARTIARALSGNGAPVYRYLFNRRFVSPMVRAGHPTA